jgi:hypothetical protein
MVVLSASERKQIANLISNSYTFLILTISNLARSCSLVKAGSTSGFQLDALNYVPDKEEIELLQSHINLKWWNVNFNKVSRNAIAIMFAHICANNKEYTEEYLSTLTRIFSVE